MRNQTIVLDVITCFVENTCDVTQEGPFLFMNLQAMGMAVMLDVIINYVLSLQQQIEVIIYGGGFINLLFSHLLILKFPFLFFFSKVSFHEALSSKHVH